MYPIYGIFIAFKYQDISDVRVCIWKRVKQLSEKRYMVEWFFTKAGQKVSENAQSYGSETSATKAAKNRFNLEYYLCHKELKLCTM